VAFVDYSVRMEKFAPCLKRNKCHKWNHFAVVCKSWSKQKPGKGKVKTKIKKTTEQEESTSSDNVDDNLRTSSSALIASEKI